MIRELADALEPFGFKDAGRDDPSDMQLVMKRQNWNTNRAVVVASCDALPEDFAAYVRQLRDAVARRCGFIPLLWPIGIQIVIIAPAATALDPSRYVALIDNQWALIQSIFLVDPGRGEYREARTWGQVVTGKFQNAIAAVLAKHYR